MMCSIIIPHLVKAFMTRWNDFFNLNNISCSHGTVHYMNSLFFRRWWCGAEAGLDFSYPEAPHHHELLQINCIVHLMIFSWKHKLGTGIFSRASWINRIFSFRKCANYEWVVFFGGWEGTQFVSHLKKENNGIQVYPTVASKISSLMYDRSSMNTAVAVGWKCYFLSCRLK